jgi:hypothetical protein
MKTERMKRKKLSSSNKFSVAKFFKNSGLQQSEQKQIRKHGNSSFG